MKILLLRHLAHNPSLYVNTCESFIAWKAVPASAGVLPSTCRRKLLQIRKYKLENAAAGQQLYTPTSGSLTASACNRIFFGTAAFPPKEDTSLVTCSRNSMHFLEPQHSLSSQHDIETDPTTPTNNPGHTFKSDPLKIPLFFSLPLGLPSGTSGQVL